MKFVTQYTDHDRVYAESGNPIRTLYRGRYDANGCIVLEEKGIENLYDYIQSFRDSVDLNVILARFSNGETDALSKAQGFYADVTDFPKNMAEALNRINECEEMFKSLPLAVRQKFDCSFEQFLSQSGSADWLEKLGFKSDSVVDDKQVVPAAVQDMKEGVVSE